MKKIPQGMFKDAELGNEVCVLYYDSRSRCYRIEYVGMMGLRSWAPVDDFGPGKRFESMGTWGLLLRQRFDLRAGRPVLSAQDFSFAD